ncbi:MAG: hypothetical protein ACRCZP_19125 [Phycicoccus sp.]
MAITSRDGLVASVAAGPGYGFYKPSVTSVAGVYHSLFRAAGNPGAGAAIGASASAAAFTRASAGALELPAPSAITYLAGLAAVGSATGTLLLCDRIGEYVADANAASTALGALTLPGRATGMVGIRAWLEIGVALGATAPGAITLTYTNQGGTAARTATITTGTVPASAIAGRTVPFTLQAGDTGVQTAQTVAHTATGTAGARTLVVLRKILGRVAIGTANIGATLGWPETGLAQIGDDACLELVWLPTGTSTGVVEGAASIAQG